MHAIGVAPAEGDLGLPNPAIIQPSQPSSSVLLARMKDLTGGNRMPPLATSLEDVARVMPAVALLNVGCALIVLRFPETRQRELEDVG